MNLMKYLSLGTACTLLYCGGSGGETPALLSQQENIASARLSATTGSYLVGTGIYDITGPAAEIVMMGYAESSQKTSGIHTRLRARSFIAGDGNKRAVFVSCDLGMLFQSVKLKVADKIAADAELKDFYNEKNTHCVIFYGTQPLCICTKYIQSCNKRQREKRAFNGCNCTDYRHNNRNNFR